MRSTLRTLTCVTFLITPSAALAAPITFGTWSPVTPPVGDGAMFWDHPGLDCGGANCSSGALLRGLFGPLEYLNDGSGNPVPFSFTEQVSVTKLGGLSAWKKGVFVQEADGSFTYDTGVSHHVHNSADQGWQFSLFRQVADDTTSYFLGVEDIRMDLPGTISDQDYNDYIVTFDVANVPEPSMLVLLGTGVAVAFRRGRRRVSYRGPYPSR